MMRALNLVKIAASSEKVRLQQFAHRQTRRAVYFAIAAIFGIAVFCMVHVLLWDLLRTQFESHWASARSPVSCTTLPTSYRPNWRSTSTGGELVPPEVLTRPPSAELRPDQRDQDSLPPYEVLDAILEGYVEHDLGREQLIARGLDPDDVDRVIRLVDRAEYKRRQQPPGIKITTRAFGRDRRVPITNRYRG